MGFLCFNALLLCIHTMLKMLNDNSYLLICIFCSPYVLKLNIQINFYRTAIKHFCFIFYVIINFDIIITINKRTEGPNKKEYFAIFNSNFNLCR